MRKGKHLNIINMRLTFADALPPSDAVMLRSAGKSSQELDIMCLKGKEIQMEEGGE